ncbi:PP2C family protein-serine/threonine phosphatase [Actinomadura sp. WMMA1423]|uniref:PP2C family protein-serine/threonine phosphatase n=1 Tax=Actinomadura sp. WMMA1423 TaxID=2591108 RepID=UPI001F1025F8|nr:PP2C family protein-serine/threonine phosphatase [Actinomadura sp. WMMA1423]
MRTESCRLSAAPRSRGDFHAVVPTPFGTRILIGDVLGAPGSAEQTAAGVLGNFRQLASHEPNLPGVAERLNSVVVPTLEDEQFVTALLLGLRGDGAEMVCCGNPPPLLLRDGRVLPLEPLPAYPPLTPLGLGDHWWEATTVPLRPDDRLLLHTYGLTEARDARGRAYPLAERFAATPAGDPAVELESIRDDLLDHAGGVLGLRTTLLLALPERQGPRPGAEWARPHGAGHTGE